MQKVLKLPLKLSKKKLAKRTKVVSGASLTPEQLAYDDYLIYYSHKDEIDAEIDQLEADIASGKEKCFETWEEFNAYLDSL